MTATLPRRGRPRTEAVQARANEIARLSQQGLTVYEIAKVINAPAHQVISTAKRYGVILNTRRVKMRGYWPTKLQELKDEGCTAADAAERLGLSPKRVYNLCSRYHIRLKKSDRRGRPPGAGSREAYREQVERMRALADEGKTAGQIAEILSMKRATVYSTALRYGIVITTKDARGRPPGAVPPSPEILARKADCIARVKAGETLESVAKTYGLTRERIRQIVGGALSHRGRINRRVTALPEHLAAAVRAAASPERTITDVVALTGTVGRRRLVVRLYEEEGLPRRTERKDPRQRLHDLDGVLAVLKETGEVWAASQRLGVRPVSIYAFLRRNGLGASDVFGGRPKCLVPTDREALVRALREAGSVEGAAERFGVRAASVRAHLRRHGMKARDVLAGEGVV